MTEQEQPKVETITISTEEGKEETFEILSTFKQDNGHQYMLLVPMEEELSEGAEEETLEQEVYPFRYEEKGDDVILYPIEEESEWDMIEEVLNTLQDEEEVD
ncbi:DUF1292 domain-containing protein [Kroppenstedtia pulmonis]|uniref:UPF0473 protein GXN76_11710 n=1 Tax=Kroppenstedtia pulmonis TaxID=1380685 RepID=A0A7D4B365_9BACL|nr:DUF1292 domain-containing protein [Kroppenstedtia pulmonis]QKG85066.1 DUF1292 domain-containing protein [Kroppenstedtia pulmonis]